MVNKPYRWGTPYTYTQDSDSFQDDLEVSVHVYNTAIMIQAIWDKNFPEPSIEVTGAKILSKDEMKDEEGDLFSKSLSFQFDFSSGTTGEALVTYQDQKIPVTWERIRTWVTLTDWHDRQLTIRLTPSQYQIVNEDLSEDEAGLKNLEDKIRQEIKIAEQNNLEELAQNLKRQLWDIRQSLPTLTKRTI